MDLVWVIIMMVLMMVVVWERSLNDPCHDKV
jgi:hypothetical protein